MSSINSLLAADMRAAGREPTLRNFIICYLVGPSMRVCMLFRVAQWLKSKKCGFLARVIWHHMVKTSGCHISLNCIIGAGINFPHPTGIVIGEGVRIGADVTIYQNVTLGLKNRDAKQYPVIGNGATIYTGALIMGDVKIKPNSVVPAYAVIK